MFEWPSKKRYYGLSLILPTSNLSVYPTIREKTGFVARVARASAVFKVSNIIVLGDSDSEDLNLFVAVLNYLLVPPYLRKRLVPLVRELRYAGALPPLNIPTHNPKNEKPRVNEIREGIVRVAFGKKGKAFFGYKRNCFITSERELFPGERVLIKIISVDPLKCVEEDPSETEIYVGYRVIQADFHNLHHVLRRLCGQGVKILTSKAGKIFTYKEARNLLKEVRLSECLTLFFGNPEKDFDEIVPKEVLESLEVTHTYNFIKGQGVYSVRTDEALFSVLSILNFILNS